jgi:hypothetical protein
MIITIIHIRGNILGQGIVNFVMPVAAFNRVTAETIVQVLIVARPHFPGQLVLPVGPRLPSPVHMGAVQQGYMYRNTHILDRKIGFSQVVHM